MSTENLYGEHYAQVQERRTPEPVLRAINESLDISISDVVLEIGAGNSDVLSLIAKQTPHVFGIDINDIAVRRTGIEEPRAQMAVGDAQKIPFKDSSFDKVILVHTLEHIIDLDSVFKELDRVTKDRSECLFVVPKDYFVAAESAMADAFRIHSNPWKAFRLAQKLHPNKLDLDSISNLAYYKGYGFGAGNSHEVLIRKFPPRQDRVIKLFKFPQPSHDE